MLSVITGMAGGAVIATRNGKKEINRIRQISDKHLALYLMMVKWVEIKQEGKRLADYFYKRGYSSIAIYGMNYVGKRLLRELRDSNVEVRYGIDQRAEEIYADINIVTADEKLSDVDAIVVTPVYFFDEIKNKLSMASNYPVISLEDILYEI